MYPLTVCFLFTVHSSKILTFYDYLLKILHGLYQTINNLFPLPEALHLKKQ